MAEKTEHDASRVGGIDRAVTARAASDGDDLRPDLDDILSELADDIARTHLRDLDRIV